jgi:TolB-like protein/thioredoxin-like negative regulator of GroEL
MSLFAELRRRNVFRVALAYLVLAWLLVQVASVLLPTFDAPAWVMRVLVLVLAAGFVGAVVFSWVFELTPEGLKRDHEVDRNASITHQTAKKLDLAVIVLLVLAIGVAAFTHFRSTPAPTAAPATAEAGDARPSLAVLPFVNMSAVAENEYFSDGLTETLLNMLAQVEGLKVTARTSAFAFKGQNKDVREIAATLNVNAVLEGSVQRAGQRVRITAQLIDARDGNHLWSQSYDRTLDDLFTIQDEIAAAVAKELTRSLLGEGDAPTVGTVGTHDREAYDAYLRGLEQANLFSFASLPEAERRFKQALARDPGFVDARIGLGTTYLRMADTGVLGGAEAAERGHSVLAPLLEDDRADPRAQAIDAILKWSGLSGPEGTGAQREAVEAVVTRAMGQAPNVVLMYGLAARVKPQSQSAEALAILDRGLQIDPLSVVLLNQRGRRLIDLGRDEEALAAFARMRELAPTSVFGTQGPMRLYERRGKYADMLYWCAKAVAADPDDHELPAHAAQYLLMMGLVAEAEPWLRRAELVNAAGSDTRRVAIQYAEQTGDRERAIALSREVLRERRDNRRFVYGVAAIYYLTLMDEAGKLDEALALIEKVSPGVTAEQLPDVDSELDIILQGQVAGFLSRRQTQAQRKARVAHFRDYLSRVDPDFNETDDIVGAVLAAMEGDRPNAIATLVKLIGDPEKLPWEWRVGLLRDPLLGELTREPEVAAAIAKVEAGFKEQGERYRKLIADGEIEVP